MNYVSIALIVTALLVIEFLVGGTRMLFSLPSYGILALAALLSVVTFKKPQIPPGRACVISALVFGLYMIGRTVWSPVPYIAHVNLFMVLAAFTVYLMSSVYLTQPRFRFIFVMTLVVLAMIHVSLGVVQYLRGEQFQLFSFIEKADYGMRATGLYVCPNHLAGFLEVVALMALSIVCWSRQHFWVKLAVGYGAVVCAVGILLTGSRGGYVSTALGVVVFGVLSFRALRRAHFHEIWAPIAVAVVIAAIMLGAALLFYSQHYSLQSRLGRVLTEDIRLRIWSLAIDQFRESPVVGTGAGTFRYLGRVYRPSDMVADPEYVHNDYLQLLAEFGVVGLALGLAFLGIHLWWGFRASNYLSTERPSSRRRLQSDALALNIGAMAAVSVYAVHSIFDFNLHIPANAILIAFILGILANPGVAVGRTTGFDKWLGVGLKLAIPAAGAWIAIGGLPTLPGEFYAERARVAFRDERYQDAIKLAGLGIVKDPTNPYLFLYQGQAYASLGEAMEDRAAARGAFTEASQAFAEARRLYPQEQWTLVGLGAALDELGRFDDARPVYEEAVRRNPNSAPIRLYFATHLRKAGQLDEAEQMYKKSIQLYWSIAAVKGLESLVKARAEMSQPPGAGSKP